MRSNVSGGDGRRYTGSCTAYGLAVGMPAHRAGGFAVDSRDWAKMVERYSPPPRRRPAAAAAAAAAAGDPAASARRVGFA